jgi:Tol biopolymer transport system component
MNKITSHFAVLCLLPVIACDPGAQPADAAAAFPGLGNAAVAVVDAPQETIPTVARRVWGGPEADILASPSPDGRFVSITDWETGDVAVRNLETGETRRVTANPAPFSPGFAQFSRVSPDGERIAYAWFDMQGGEFELRVVDWDGSEPRALVKGLDTYPQAWSPDGRHVLAVREGEESGCLELVLVGTADGAVTVLEPLGPFQPQRAEFSPDGRFVAYDGPSEEHADQRDIFVVELAGGRSTRIVDDASHDFMLGWAPEGEHILYSSDRTGTPGVWLLPVSGGRPTGDPALVLPDAWGVSPVGFLPDGRYFYGVETEVRGVYVATLGADYGSLVTPPSPATRGRLGGTYYPTWSPDGQYLAYGRASAAGMRPSLTVRSLETGEVREFQLAFNNRPASELQWTPDGRSLLGAVRDESGLTSVYRIDLQTGRTEAVSDWSAEFHGRIELSPDGRFVYYSVVEGGPDGMSVRVFRKDLVGGGLEEVYGSTGWVRRLVLSPDGSSLVAALQLPEHQTQVVLFPAAGGEVRELTPIDPRSVISLAWTPDSKTILYARQKEPAPTFSTVEVLRVAVEGGEPEPIGLEMEMLSQLRIHPDGRRLAFVAGEPSGELWVMEDFLPGSR